jgi:hypothetical protein
MSLYKGIKNKESKNCESTWSDLTNIMDSFVIPYNLRGVTKTRIVERAILKRLKKVNVKANVQQRVLLKYPLLDIGF